ncbi:MAG: energy transducer TonB [Bacteroidales bacterium]|nr:energy transducer TonB [Bacteroidales bacterium]
MKTTILKSICVSALYLVSAFGVSFAQSGKTENTLPEVTGLSTDLVAATYSNVAFKNAPDNVNLAEVKNVEVYPAPENGMDFNTSLKELIEYPKCAVDEGVEGVVKVMCTIETDGSISNVMVLEDIGSECAEQVCKAVRNLKLKPAMQNGFARKMVVIIPVRFDLI